MKIHDDHLYHGAALIQIAEHPQFTAINALKLKGKAIRVGYKINDNIAVYFKYASKPSQSYREYVFTFSREHLDEIFRISEENDGTFVVLVCVKDREICCLTYEQLRSLVIRREKAHGAKEDNLTVLVTIPKGKSMRVYVNAPGRRKVILGKEIIVSRNAYPDAVFE